MKIFLDANILVSVLNSEYPVFPYTSRILSLVDNKKYEVFTSPICLSIAFYFSEKKSGTKAALNKIKILADKVKITTVNGEVVQQSIANKKVTDFEDGIEYYSALAAKCKCIITENEEDFYCSDIEIINARNFVEKYLL